jgi:hypothetical protein
MSHWCLAQIQVSFLSFLFFFLVVLGLEFRAYTSSHSTEALFFLMVLQEGLLNHFRGLALNRDPADLCLLNS